MFPILFRLGQFRLPTFGALAATGLMLALALSARTAALAGVDPDALWDAGLFAVVTAFVLSRVQLVLLHWEQFRRFPLLVLAVPSLTATGLLLTGVAVLLWLWVKRISLKRGLDAWAAPGAVVWVFLALGHLAEGSDPGMPTGAGWGVPAGGERLHPVALYAAFAATLLAAAAYRLLRARVPAGATAGMTLLGAGVAQFLLSFVRQPGAEGPLGLDLLEWAALGMMVAGVALGLAALGRAPQPVS